MPGAPPQNKIKFLIPNGPWSELPEPYREPSRVPLSPDVKQMSRIPAGFGVSPPIEYTFVL